MIPAHDQVSQHASKLYVTGARRFEHRARVNGMGDGCSFLSLHLEGKVEQEYSPLWPHTSSRSAFGRSSSWTSHTTSGNQSFALSNSAWRWSCHDCVELLSASCNAGGVDVGAMAVRDGYIGRQTKDAARARPRQTERQQRRNDGGGGAGPQPRGHSGPGLAACGNHRLLDKDIHGSNMSRERICL
jgi:hypothetical protein